jgi:hypothetical protein
LLKAIMSYDPHRVARFRRSGKVVYQIVGVRQL